MTSETVNNISATSETVSATSETPVTTITTTNSPSEARMQLLNASVKVMENMTTQKTLKQKLSSRKFWMSLAGLVCGIAGMIGVNDNIIGIISFGIVSVGSIIGYIISEGMVDANSVKSLLEVIGQIVDRIDELDGAATTTVTTINDSTGTNINMIDGTIVNSDTTEE